MAERVNKPFNSETRRFKPGMDVEEADVAPLDWKHLKDAGFIGAPSVSAYGSAAAQSDDD